MGLAMSISSKIGLLIDFVFTVLVVAFIINTVGDNQIDIKELYDNNKYIYKEQ